MVDCDFQLERSSKRKDSLRIGSGVMMTDLASLVGLVYRESLLLLLSFFLSKLIYRSLAASCSLNASMMSKMARRSLFFTMGFLNRGDWQCGQVGCL